MKRDLLVTYKQTLLGILWVIIQPIVMALSIIFVFKHIGRFPDYGVPYVLIAFTALGEFPENYFDNKRLLKKRYRSWHQRCCPFDLVGCLRFAIFIQPFSYSACINCNSRTQFFPRVMARYS
jgi:hypothetical protein